MANRSREWQSYPVEYRDRNFPSLSESAKYGKQKKRSHHRIGSNTLSLPHPNTILPFQYKNEWPTDDVEASNSAVVEESPSFSDPVHVQELKTVHPTFTDYVTAMSRYDPTGYEKMGGILVKNLQSRPPDPSEPYRTLAVPVHELESNERDGAFNRRPDPSATPKWNLNLPDQKLTEEFMLISYLRPLDVPLGPKTIEVLKKKCNYLPTDSRKLPVYKADPTVVQPTPLSPMKSCSQVSVHSNRSTSWHDSKSVNKSGLPYGSSGYAGFVPQYGSSGYPGFAPPYRSGHSKPSGVIEFRNSCRSSSSKGNRREHVDNRETSNQFDYMRAPPSSYKHHDDYIPATPSSNNHEWDNCYEYPSIRKSSRYNGNGYGREGRGDGDYYTHSDYRSEYDNQEDSGYHGENDRSSYMEDDQRCLSPPTDPIEPVATEYSTKTPAWITDYAPSSGERRNPNAWRVRQTNRLPDITARVEKEEKRSEGDQKRDEDPDARHYWKCVEVPVGVRRALRCLEGVPANSCAAYADDMHRVELSTWSGEEDAAEVAERMREKYCIGQRERECEERTVHLALPRTTITLVVGAGGEAEILFDGDCTDVLVRGLDYEDVREVIDERVIKSHDFVSYAVDSQGDPSTSKNTLITFASPEESRAVRQRFINSDVDAKKIPRDLITGYWDGTYAKRECSLELQWERHGTHGISVRFTNLGEQNNLVDRIMRDKSEYFMSSHVNMEETFNRMYVSVPSSPFPVDDDMKFLKHLLEENGVGVAAIFPLKCKEGPQTIESKMKQSQCKVAINRRILKVAIEEGVWGGFHPRTTAEWQMMLEEARFSWDIEMHNDRDLENKGENSATVHFDSYEQGVRIAAQVQRMTPLPIGEDRFILNKGDRKGVFARAKLRVHYNVPVHVQALTKFRLKMLDESWREDAHFSHADFHSEREPSVRWACLITGDGKESTPPGFCRLIVEGFPKSYVEEACNALLDVIRGDVLKCDGAEWLLTGVGRNMADIVAKEALVNNKVLVDFNVLGEEIRMIGETWEVEKVEERLKSIAERRKSLVMRTQVSVRQPLYMNRASEAIVHCGGTRMMERVVGECRITPCHEDVDKRTLRFEGTVAAHDRFRDFLGDLDDTLRESAKAEFEKLRKTNPKLQDSSLSPLTSALLCPICCCRPAADFYRLEACGHIYCTACIYHQLHSELSTRTLPLACRRAGCERKLAVSDLLRLLLGRDPEWTGETGLEHLDERKLRPLVTAIVTNALQTKRDRLIACRTADCAGIFPRLKEDANSLVRCKTCERTACGACGYEPHRGTSCEEYERLRDNVDVSIASYMKNKKVRKCPNNSCSAVIEKTIGCNHMECVICRTHFCWLCGAASRSQGEIYAHMQNDHGGNGLHMDDGEMFMLQFDD